MAPAYSASHADQRNRLVPQGFRSSTRKATNMSVFIPCGFCNGDGTELSFSPLKEIRCEWCEGEKGWDVDELDYLFLSANYDGANLETRIFIHKEDGTVGIPF